MDLHQADADPQGIAGPLHQSLPVAGSALLAPGTYNVGVICIQVPASGGGTVGRFTAAMNVVALPTSS